MGNKRVLKLMSVMVVSCAGLLVLQGCTQASSSKKSEGSTLPIIDPGSGGNPPDGGTGGTGGTGGALLRLSASRIYAEDEAISEEKTYSFNGNHQDLMVPEALSVLEGLPGIGIATLEFTLPSGSSYICAYIGDGVHRNSPECSNNGSEYSFEFCVDGETFYRRNCDHHWPLCADYVLPIQPQTIIQASEVSLRVILSDNNCGTTSVETEIQYSEDLH